MSGLGAAPFFVLLLSGIVCCCLEDVSCEFWLLEDES